ncbi:MAG: hypothetical protein WAW90_00945, partial [Minisyncoccia bacterium]
FTLSGVQALATKFDAQDVRLTALEDRVAKLDGGAVSSASGSPISLSFASSTTSAQITSWFANAGNGIGNLFAKTFHASEQICVDDQCLTKDDVRALLMLVHPLTTPSASVLISPTATSTDMLPSSTSTVAPTEATSSSIVVTDTTPPAIVIETIPVDLTTGTTTP